MIRDRRSATAAGVAIARAMEHMRAPGDRILEDPYAIAFAQGDPRRFAVTSGPLRRLALRVFERLMPGTVELVAARGRYADGLVTARAGAGCDQLVVLGAGFDTASLRLAPHLPGVTIFEVDHPATQSAKRRVVERLAPEGARIRFVEVDFERDDLAGRLTAAGFDARRKSVVTWMGVSYYLTPAAFASTLATLAGLMAPESALAFDYVLRSVVDGTHAHPAARRGTRRAARSGEPFLFGMDPGEAEQRLARDGFVLEEQYSADDLARRYTRGRRGAGDFAWVATAERAYP